MTKDEYDKLPSDEKAHFMECLVCGEMFDRNIGNAGVAGDSNMIRIGEQGTHDATFIAGIAGATVASGVGVIVDADGRLGTVTSSARFKEAVKPMDKASEAILALTPVTFRYKEELDPDGTRSSASWPRKWKR
jgi:hypothetical protein